MANQGCVAEGPDTRMLGWLICPLQRWLSFRWPTEPISIILAFPPYLVINVPLFGNRRMLMFRIGWRYDRTFKGFIFPTAALKIHDHTTALLY